MGSSGRRRRQVAAARLSSRSFRRPSATPKYVSRWTRTPCRSAPSASARSNVASGSGSAALTSTLRRAPPSPGEAIPCPYRCGPKASRSSITRWSPATSRCCGTERRPPTSSARRSPTSPAFLGYEALRDLRTHVKDVEDPAGGHPRASGWPTTSSVIAILRAGLGMGGGLPAAGYPEARVGHLRHLPRRGVRCGPSATTSRSHEPRPRRRVRPRGPDARDRRRAPSTRSTACARAGAGRGSASSASSRPPRASRAVQAAHPGVQIVCATLSTASSTRTPTSGRAWATRATGSSGPDRPSSLV